MSQNVVQSVAANLVTILTGTTGLPKTGLTSADVTCTYRKEGQSSFTAKSLNGSNFTEIGSGVYTIQFTSAELNTLGSFTWIVSGATIQTFTGLANVVTDAAATTAPTVVTCNLTGKLAHISGAPIVNAAVTARIVGFPVLENSGNGIGVGFATESVSVKTDSNGVFSLTLGRLLEVEISIPAISYKRIITVPNSTSKDLFAEVA